MRVLGYVRVSSVEQADEGLSLAVQEKHIRSYCEMRGLQLVEIIRDPGVSANKPLLKRRGGAQLLDALIHGRAEGVVAVKLDRLFRNVIDCLHNVKQWDESQIALHLVNQGGASIDSNSAIGRFLLLIIAGVAEMERNMTRERTVAVIEAKHQDGERTGTIPFGFTLGPGNRSLVPEPNEQRTLAYIQRLRSEGLSFLQIAQRLNKENVRARVGTWTKAKVMRLLQREQSGWRADLPRHGSGQ